MAERALVVGFTWIDGSVHLRSWAGDRSALGLRLLEGEVCFRVLAGKHCVGWNDGEGLRSCPDRALATRGTACETCGSRDAFRPCMTCDGFRCPRLSVEMHTWCRQTHHLYLACFGDSTIKVGTASDARKSQRIIEQGPLAAAVEAVPAIDRGVNADHEIALWSPPPPMPSPGPVPEGASLFVDGVLQGFMHSKETALRFEVPPTGNARAFEFSDEPLVRMRNTSFLPGSSTLDEMIASVDDGYYLMRASNGQADATSEFMFGVVLGYEIKGGKIDVKADGNIKLKGSAIAGN